MISPKDILDYKEAVAMYRERHPESTSEDAENALNSLSCETKLEFEKIFDATATRILRKIAIANIIREAIVTVILAVGGGGLAYLFLDHPRWIIITICALGFGAYHTGLLYRIGLREDKKL